MRPLARAPHLLLIATVCGAGLMVGLAAAISFAATRPTRGELAGPLVLLGASTAGTLLVCAGARFTLTAMRLALTDALTGLPNQRSFQQCIQRELIRAEARNAILTLCLIDIDDFKRVNDLFGHPVGDVVLAQVGARLRQDGEAFRLGGDEFALLLPAHRADEAFPVAQSVLSRVAALDLGPVGSVTASAGIASSPGQAFDRDELIRRADRALYRAKEQGKNRVATIAREPGSSASAAPAGAPQL